MKEVLLVIQAGQSWIRQVSRVQGHVEGHTAVHAEARLIAPVLPVKQKEGEQACRYLDLDLIQPAGGDDFAAHDKRSALNLEQGVAMGTPSIHPVSGPF